MPARWRNPNITNLALCFRSPFPLRSNTHLSGIALLPGGNGTSSAMLTEGLMIFWMCTSWACSHRWASGEMARCFSVLGILKKGSVNSPGVKVLILPWVTIDKSLSVAEFNSCKMSGLTFSKTLSSSVEDRDSIIDCVRLNWAVSMRV